MSALKKSLLSLGVQASSTTKVVMEGGNGEGGEVPLDLFSGRGPRDPQDFVIDHFEDGDPSNPMVSGPFLPSAKGISPIHAF